MYNNIPTKVLTGEVRLSYVNLVSPSREQQRPHRDPEVFRHAAHPED